MGEAVACTYLVSKIFLLAICAFKNPTVIAQKIRNVGLLSVATHMLLLLLLLYWFSLLSSSHRFC